MKALIIYDSMYGNTEKIARYIGSAITGDVRVQRISEANLSDDTRFHAIRITQEIQDFLNKVSETTIRGIHVAAFDT